MKAFKISLCALLVICAGCVFTACREKKKDFNISDIVIGNVNEFVYDGNPHAIDISYEGKDVDVTYALSTDKNNFKTLNGLNIVDAGVYDLYYKISAKGYNSYVSDGTLELTILPKEITVQLNDLDFMKSSEVASINPGYVCRGIVKSDAENKRVPINVYVDGEFNKENVEYGETYHLTCSTTNKNYKIKTEGSTLTIKDYAHIANADESVKKYYPNIQEAISDATSGETVVLNNNVYLKEMLEISKSVKIDGQNKFSIASHARFAGKEVRTKTLNSLINISNVPENENVELTLKDVTINGNQLARGLSAFAGKVIVDNATITNGKITDGNRAGGVLVSELASFEMNSGKIFGNTNEEDNLFGADLWIGANSNGTISSINGGEIEKVVVEYEGGVGGALKYEAGDISNFYISLANTNSDYSGVKQEITPVAGTEYRGGKLVYEESELEFSDKTYDVNIDSLLQDNNNYVFENCTFNVPISSSKKVGLIFNNCTFTTSEDSTNLYLSAVTDLVVNNCEFNGSTTGGHAIDINLYSSTCENIMISNNVFNTTSTSDNVAIAVKARLGITDTPIDITGTEGKITGIVKIIGNDFVSESNNIYIGTTPQGISTSANTSSGDFVVLVEGNLDSVSIHNKFKDNAYVTKPTVITIQEKGVYDSTKE